MADQKTTLKIDGDASGLLSVVKSALSQIQKEADKLKLSPSAAKVAPGASTAPGSAGYQAHQQAFNAVRAQETKTRSEQQAAEISKRNLADLNRQLAANAKLEATSVKNDRDRAFYAAERNRLEKAYQTELATTKRLEGQGPAGKGGGAGIFGGMPKGGITSMGGLASALGVPGMVMAGIGTAIAAGTAVEKTRQYFSQADNRARETEASAFNMQGQGGQRLASFFNGGAGEEFLFNPQRLQAAKNADIEMRNNLNSSTRLFTRPLQTLLGTGDMGLKDANGNLQNGLPNQYGFGTDAVKRKIQAEQDQEKADIQARQFEAIKNGPEGKVITEVSNKYLRDWRRNLDFQRQTGQSEESFRGFLGGVNRAGFQDEQGMQMSSAIMGAGGSTRAATGDAGFALQMQRAFGLTNAGKAVGEISGRLGSSEMSKEALIRIQAEGTRLGLNQSEFQEENRKFVDMASSVINKSNITSGAGVDQLVDTLSKFMGDKTTTGMEAGKSAYEAYQRQSNIQNGPSATMRAAGMMRNPVLNKLNGEEQASLFTMSQSDVNVDDLGIQALARKAGKTPQQLVDAYHDVQNASLFTRKSTDANVANVSEAYRKQGPLSSGEAYAAGFQNIAGAEGEAQNSMALEPAGQGLDRRGQLALVRARASGDTAEISRLLQGGVKTAAEAGQTGRPGDQMERQQAEASRMANELFTSIQKSILPAADDVAKFTARINELVAAMKGSDTARINAAINALGPNSPGGHMPSNQPSAGPPANGAGP